jgi:putative flippase GtrA
VITALRFGKFGLVGAMGTVVQLSSLALLNRWMSGRYLWASLIALEVALLHNFFWHTCCTWRDRPCGWPAFLRFHMSAGLAAMPANLLLMALLAGRIGLPVVPANGIAIACWGLMNFWLGNRWVFSAEASPGLPGIPGSPVRKSRFNRGSSA